MNLLIVTGLSGSGKSIALHTLEDLGYYCIDNLPLGMLDSLTEQIKGDWGPDTDHIAVGLDARALKNSPHYHPDRIRDLQKTGIDARVLYLHADEHTLLKRFNETRRKHPLTGDNISLIEALKLEQKLLEPLAHTADIQIDTSHTNVHQLRDTITERLKTGQDQAMSIKLQSFGFKYGMPTDVDLVFDIRCLPNPHWESGLRSQTGNDPDVIDYLEQHDDVHQMKQDLLGFLETWLPRFEKTNRSYMSIAIGCTGGQHRSVYMTNSIGKHLSANRKNIIVRHRELS